MFYGCRWTGLSLDTNPKRAGAKKDMDWVSTRERNRKEGEREVGKQKREYNDRGQTYYLSGLRGDSKNTPVPMTYKYQPEATSKTLWCIYSTTTMSLSLSLFVFHTHRPQKYTEEDFVPLLFPCSPLPAPPSPINNRNNDFPERPCLVFGIWGVPGVAVGYHHRVRCGVSATEWVRVENV